MMHSPFRYPDKPTQSHQSVLPTLRDGEWLGQMKHNGWRCYVDFDAVAPGRPARAQFVSREKSVLRPSPALHDAVLSALGRVAPKAGWGCLLDAELMGRRDDQPEGLVLLDALMTTTLGWIGDRGARDRLAVLRAMSIDPLVLPVVETRESGYAGMFEDSRRVAGVEGIVLKRVESSFVGSVRKSIDNPRWLKVKHHDGCDGQQEVR